MEVADNQSEAYEDSMAGKKKTVEKEKRASKKKRAAEVSSPESTRSGSESPEPNCAICLGRLQNKSFTDSCFHMFCFTCLLEWSKVKAVCPLCKQAFKSIIHNVRSNQLYDQYFLRSEESGSPDEGRFRYRTTLTTERWMFRQQMEQQRQLRMLQRPTSHTARSQWRRMRQAATSAFRQRIYTENMWVRDLTHPPNRPPRYRNISVAFFKRNPAASHRLVPWLNRELNVILHNREDHVQFVLELIMDLIKRFEIQSEEFLEHIRSFMGERSEHFVHEFYSFARSPYDMVAYDSHAVYDEPEPPQVHSIESDSSSDNDDVILVSPSGRNNQDSDDISFSNPEPPNVNSRNTDLSPLLTRVRDFLAFIDTSQMGGWDSPLPGPSSLRWSPVTTSLSEIERSQPTNSQRDSHRSRRLTVELSPSSEPSDEDDIMIVGYEKAWDRRTPIQLSSGDESSSPEKQSSPRSQRKHRKNHESKRHSHEKKKTKSSRRRHSRSRSSEGHSSHHRSRSRERHYQLSRDKRCLREHSADESRASTSRSKPQHHRFPSDSPSRKRSRRSMSSEYSSKSSGKLRSHSKDRHHHSKSSSSPHSRRRDRSPSPRLRSSSPEYCGSYRHDHGRYYHERVSERHRSYHSYTNRRQNHGSRSRETSIESRAESRKRHRHHSSSSIETIYEKSRSDSKRHKSRKQKKQKKHKKHKSKDRERKPDDDDSSTGVEIVEISEDEAGGKSEEHQESQDSNRWKKHPTGHKKSSKSKSEGNSSDTTSSGTHTGQESTEPSSSYSETSSFHPAYSETTPLLNCVRNFLADAAKTDSREVNVVKPHTSSYDRSKWKPVGGGNDECCVNEATEKDVDVLRCNETSPSLSNQKDKETKEKCTDSNTETSSCTPDSGPSSAGSPSCSTSDNKSNQISPSPDSECDTNERSVEPDSSCGGEYTSPLKSNILGNIDNHQESLHEIEKTLRANILNRLSNSKSLHKDTPSSAS